MTPPGGTSNSAGLTAYREAAAARPEAEREAEITRHLPLVHSVVERLLATLPPHVDRDDLFHAGVLGLIDAVDRFDASRDNAFSTYAVLRIRGAIIDELRARDWIPRGTRSRARDYQQAVAKLSQALGRAPTDDELADELGIDEADLAQVERDAHLAVQVSLETPVGDDGQLGNLIADRNADTTDPMRNLDRDDRRRVLLGALEGLKEQERILLKLYYFEGLLMKEIASIMGVTESRVCQIHGRLMTLLRGRLAQAGLST